MAGDSVFREPSVVQIITEHVTGLRDRQAEHHAELATWQSSPEIPTSGELMAMDPAPLPGALPVEGFSKAEYLETQYRLQRHEGTELLRRSVNQFRDQPDMLETPETYVYSQVHIKGYMFARKGAACRISFSTERSPEKVLWAQSTRLTAGTLVALSPRSDNFRNECFVAVVAARYLIGGLQPDFKAGEDENTPPRIEIFWGDTKDARINPSDEFIMLESKGGYFEPVRHAMVGLQHASFHNSKFDKYILEGCLRDPSAHNLRGRTATIPDAASSFDHSQLDAFNRMTSRELAIVQGPPGTGKTFTSIVAVESYIQTMTANAGKDEPLNPIIVSAQTNHALDQLLGACISRGANVVRLGGRSQVESINERTLFNLKRGSKAARNTNARGEGARKSLLKKAKDLLSSCFPGGIISADYFHQQGLITQEQLDSLKNDDWETPDPAETEDEDDDASGTDSFNGPMYRWLGDCIEEDKTYVYCPPRNQADGQPTEEDQEEPEDDERDRLHGEFVDTEFYYTGSMPEAHNRTGSSWFSQAKRALEKHSDLYDIKPPRRGMVYRYLRQRLVDQLAEKFRKLLSEYQKTCNTVKIGTWQSDVKVIQHERIEVLGCTTTGLTKYRGLIAALKPRILMIEEAAETREANITSALYPSLDQLVLVGDHQQLVPHVDVRELGRAPYNLHISLFERLVRLDLPYSMLLVQRRMIPAIREVVHAFYPKLEDHEVVKSPKNRPPVPGMGGKNLWWFQHQWGEQQNSDSFSYCNMSEADMIVGFVQYLVQNDVRPSQITMLTYYKGQVDLLQEKLRNNTLLSNLNPTKDWSVRTVDGFQGEENEIILLSLVRSPASPHDQARVGFVDDENRAVVATSRARCGMYIFGNSNNILANWQSNQTWQKVYDVFLRQESIGYELPVACKKHGDITYISQPNDWSKIPDGGCERPCEETCLQGHPCSISCHAVDQSRLMCHWPCAKRLPCGHKCGSSCGDLCQCPQGCDKPALMNTLPHRPGPTTNTSRNTTTGQTSRRTPNQSNPPRGSQVPQVPQDRQGFRADRGGQRNRNQRTQGGGHRTAQPLGSASHHGKSKRLGPLTAQNWTSRTTHHVSERPQNGFVTTSDDMLTAGYHAQIAKQDTTRAQRESEGSSTSELLIDTSPETTPDLSPEVSPRISPETSVCPDTEMISHEGSVASFWSAEIFQQKERAYQFSQATERQELGGRHTVVHETHLRTVADPNLGRVITQRTSAEFEIFTDSEPVQPVQCLTTATDEPVSRTQQALDAAAGLVSGRSESASTVVQEQRAMAVEDTEMDLISFD